jgi:asparagine synthase (glutamine-hydrolysing)
MCGIAGIIYKNGIPENREAILKSMLTSIAHRGPDDEGMYFDGAVALGHRRLSVLDLSSAGHQPMKHKDYLIVYNGEVYNYLELRDELKRFGHTFTTGTDTEVILHAYDQWGEDCLNRFNGMWAFAIYDKRKQTLFCSRDRFGVKPFYYYEDNEKLIFASEIKAILCAGVKPVANIPVLMAYLVVGFVNNSEQTFFKGIHQLMPGSNLSFNTNTGSVSLRQYYDLSKLELPEIDSVDFARHFENSIRLHLRSDVPIGTCLSGGLDSSTVAAIASNLLRELQPDARFGAITAQSESSENDESEYARQVVEHCRLDWHLVKPTYDDFVQHIDDCLRVQGEPVGGPSVFMQYWVMKKAKDAGFKVMLDGQGGDETLLGYERYYPAFFLYLLKRGRCLLFLKEYYQAVRHSRLSTLQLTAFIAYFLILPIRKKILTKRVNFLKPSLIHQGLAALNTPANAFFDIRTLQEQELMIYQLPKLLLYEDRNSMAHSIEARVPFVSYPCVEAALALKPTSKIRSGYTKYALRLIAERLLPKSIAWRRNKIGFEAPSRIWLKKHRPQMQAKIAHSSIISNITTSIPSLELMTLELQWRMYNIAVWEEQYKAVYEE